MPAFLILSTEENPSATASASAILAPFKVCPAAISILPTASNGFLSKTSNPFDARLDAKTAFEAIIGVVNANTSTAGDIKYLYTQMLLHIYKVFCKLIIALFT